MLLVLALLTAAPSDLADAAKICRRGVYTESKTRVTLEPQSDGMCRVAIASKAKSVECVVLPQSVMETITSPDRVGCWAK
jgi:hypothetical protein